VVQLHCESPLVAAAELVAGGEKRAEIRLVAARVRVAAGRRAKRRG
jgi:hypothetical protein